MKTLLLSALLLGALPLTAQVTPALNYQGRVAVNGAPFTGTGQFLFALLDAEGTAHWSSHASATTPVSVADGLYSVRLGDTTLPNMAAVPSAIFSNADLSTSRSVSVSRRGSGRRVWGRRGCRGFRR